MLTPDMSGREIALFQADLRRVNPELAAILDVATPANIALVNKALEDEAAEKAAAKEAAKAEKPKSKKK